MPFPIRALQIDGGPEFAAEFEQACQQRGLHLFVLPPRSPKLNGRRATRESQSESPPLAYEFLDIRAGHMHRLELYSVAGEPHFSPRDNLMTRGATELLKPGSRLLLRTSTLRVFQLGDEIHRGQQRDATFDVTADLVFLD
jgi:hypothetical protein